VQSHLGIFTAVRRPALAVLLFVLLFAGCARTEVVLWTDVPELVPAVELFNASQEEHVVELVYEPELGSALRLAETPPDVVVGSYIEDRATAQLFQPVDRLLRRELRSESFYSDLLATGVRDGRHYLLPVAFNLPLVYFTSEVPAVGTPIVMAPEEMRRRGEQFNASEEDRWIRLAYSPIWSPEFLYQYLRLHGFTANEAEDGDPDWSFEALVSGISAAQDWIDLHGGLESDLAFQEKYLYDPQIQLVRQGRVAYGYDTSAHFLGLSDRRREELDFRWLGTAESIRVLEGVVYAGIPEGARARRGAERFLVGLLSLDEQIELIESSRRKRVDAFGVVGGLSSLWRLNEEHLAAFYPELEGKIPPADWLTFPPASPRHWGELIAEVVQPWLIREVMGTPQSRDLEQSVQAWLLQQED
jgi:hypothetical protein